MIALIDYRMGNLRSVAKALEKVGATVLVTSKPEDLERAYVVPKDKNIIVATLNYGIEFGSIQEAKSYLKRRGILIGL